MAGESPAPPANKGRDRGGGLAFGILTLGDIEVAIPATVLQEVVAWPDHIVAHVLAPDYILGTFSLRGMAVPAVDLRILFRLGTAGRGQGRIVILHTARGWLGLAVDGTVDVVRPAAAAIHYLTSAAPPHETQLIRSLLMDPSSQRVIQILDVDTLVAQPGVMLRAADGVAPDRRSDRVTRQLLFFDCDDIHFCIEGSAVREVIETPDIERICNLGEVYRGVLRLRGQAIPVIDLSTLLALSGSDTPKARLLVLDVGGHVVGVLVTAVVAIQRLATEHMLPLPRLGLTRTDLFFGIIAGEQTGRADAILLNHEAIMLANDITVLQRLLNGLGETNGKQEFRSAVGTRTAFLSFEAGDRHTVALGQVQEIMPMPADYLRLGAPDGIVLGLVKRRGTMVSLVSFRRLAGHLAKQADRDSRVLLIQGEQMMFALLVDGTHAVEHVFVREKLANEVLPGTDLIRAATGLLVVDGAGGQRVMAVLDLVRIAAHLECMAASENEKFSGFRTNSNCLGRASED